MAGKGDQGKGEKRRVKLRPPRPGGPRRRASTGRLIAASKATGKSITGMVSKSTFSAGLKVLIVTPEAVPFAKVGGLGDVVGALAKYLRQKGVDVRILMPRYYSVPLEPLTTIPGPLGIPVGFGEEWAAVMESVLPGTEVPVYFLDQQELYGRDGVYGNKEESFFKDNARRFAFLSRGAFQLCKKLNWIPDVMHANDWATAPVTIFLNTWEKDGDFAGTGSLLTIHNLGYQGNFPKSEILNLQLGWEAFHGCGLEFFDRVNYLKAGLHNADVLNTVSPGYANDIQTPEFGCMLEGYLQHRRDDLHGILNGMDYEVWNPATDPLLPVNYTADDLSGKAAVKAALQKEMNLPVDPKKPLFGMISRLTDQKGFGDLCGPAHGSLYAICADMDIQMVILGSGDAWCERELKSLSGRLPNLACVIGYDNRLAHVIEGGSDFFLMPSQYEPCGLNQMYSLGYGSIPIVRATGGLRDTVENYNEVTGEGTGFVFTDLSPRSIYDSVGWACSTWYDRPEHIEKLRQNGMAKRFTWDQSAKDYISLYRKAIAKRRG